VNVALSLTRPIDGSAIVRLSAGAAFGIGEATPLPGYSPETIDEAVAALHGLTALAPFDADEVHAWLSGIKQLGSPAAQFALETAAFDLAGKLLETPVHALLGGSRGAAIPVNALVSNLAGARAAVDDGFGTLKIKLGRCSFAEDLALLEILRAEFGDGIQLRADANGRWSVDEATSYLPRLVHVGLQYIEEPVASELLPTLASPITLAADESLSRLPASRALENPAVRIFVLKPMLLGGLLRCVDLASAATAAGASVVVSHMFDGPIARTACAELCLALQPTLACGLAEHDRLGEWPELVTPQIADARIAQTQTVGLGCTGVEALWT